MMVISRLNKFIKRNQKKIIFSSSILIIGYLISNYLTKKFNEFQKKLKEENFAKEQIKRRFKQTQNDCYMTFLSLLPVLIEPIYLDLNVESITKQLQAKRIKRSTSISISQSSIEKQEQQEQQLNEKDLQQSNQPALSTIFSDDFSTVDKSQSQLDSSNQDGQQQQQEKQEQQTKSKTQLWIELRNQSLTRFLTVLYCESLLIVFLHLQLNILSRKSYLETAIKLASKNNEDIIYNSNISEDDDLSDHDDENLSEQAFLSFSWWLLNKGWIDIKENISNNVEEVFNEIDPRQEMSIDEFANLISRTQGLIDHQILLPRVNNNNSKQQEQNEFSNIDNSTYNIISNPNNNNNNNNNNGNNTSSSILIESFLPPKEMEFYLLQQTNDIDFISKYNSNLNNIENLDKLLIELNNYLNNEKVGEIISLLVTVGITKVLDNIVILLLEKSSSLNKQPTSQESNESAESVDESSQLQQLPKVKLASLLAQITKQSNKLTNNSLDNDILYTLNNLEELDDLSAGVYSNFDA
ncbi:hypothetical protein B5S32_g5364 [[Candida] boidinii]|nr:hypothetical protein B5S32_g5364 [[Candida] boidinii]